jgi:hypothetical protein
MTARSPIVKVELTEEQKHLVPDWEEQKEIFQRNCNKRAKDKRELFRHCLHEGGHAVQFRNQFGWDVKFHGPRVDFEDGKLQFVLGAVSPVRINNYEPLHWQHGMVSTSSFLLVEHFTGLPDDQFTIQNDLQTLRSKLGENEDMNRAVWHAEIMLEGQLSEPTFLPELERAVRDYELAIYGTDEATKWGWKEYHPELLGTRHRVAVTTSGYFGTLVEHDGDLKLVVEGEVYRPGDELRGVRPDVQIAEPQKTGTHRVVQAWNEAVRQNLDEQTADVAGSNKRVVQSV